jgi:hypothetical protein
LLSPPPGDALSTVLVKESWVWPLSSPVVNSGALPSGTSEALRKYTVWAELELGVTTWNRGGLEPLAVALTVRVCQLLLRVTVDEFVPPLPL